METYRTPRQRERRQRILSTARELVARVGYDGLSMRELADLAEVSPTTLYNLYENKDLLILAAVQNLLQEVTSLPQGKDESALSYYIRYVEASFEKIQSMPEYAEAMARILFLSASSDKVVQFLLGDNIRRSSAAILEMKQAGTLRQEADARRLARGLVAQSWAVLLLWLKGFVALHDIREEAVYNLLSLLRAEATEEGVALIETVGRERGLREA